MTANTPQSRKAKGRKWENEVAEICSEIFDTKVERKRIGTEKDDLIGLPDWLSIECKRTEKLDLWGAVNQARENANGKKWVVAYKANNKEPLAIMGLKEARELLRVFEWLGKNRDETTTN